jgi:large subunit ribosomal protein L5
MASRLQQRYREEIIPALMKSSHKNAAQAPRLEKVTLNVGAGEAVQNAKALMPPPATSRRLPGNTR